MADTIWKSKFGGSAWEYVPGLKKWYLHLFDVTQADLNWDNPQVREELKEILRFWKAKGIAGFRFDVINLVSKPQRLEDDFEGDGRRFYSDGPHIHEYLKELVRDAGIQELVTVGEMSSTSLKHCIRYSAPEEKELSMCFQFHHLKVDYKDGDKWGLQAADYRRLKELFMEWQLGMQQADGWNALFWCNHDQPRIASRLGDEGIYWKESAKMLAGMIHFMRGTPYIYQGEISFLETGTDMVLAYKRVLGPQQLAVFCNLDRKQHKIKVPAEWNSCPVLLSNYKVRERIPETEMHILQPYEFLVLGMGIK